MAETPDSIDLVFVVRKLDRLINDVAALKDDMNVLTSIVLRQDGSITALLTEIRALHSQMQRMNNRVSKLEAASP